MMEMTFARIIITLACNRKCKYCANKYPHILKQARRISSVDEIGAYKAYMITGGEPVLELDKTLRVIYQIKIKYPTKPVYVYSAYHEIIHILDKVDGINYTLHSNSTEEDIINFYRVQSAASHYPEKSMRLKIHPDMEPNVTIMPKAWRQIRLQHFLRENECKVPNSEQLFLLED